MTSEPELEFGARLLVPHRNAGETIWAPDIVYAAWIVTETKGMAELMQRRVGPWEPVLRNSRVIPTGV